MSKLAALWDATTPLSDKNIALDEENLFSRLVHLDQVEGYNSESVSETKGHVVFEKPSSAGDERKYFEIEIELPFVIEWTQLDVFSTARNVELYTSKDREYSQTCRFTEKLGEGSAYQYHCECTASSHQEGASRRPSHSKFVIRFLSLDYPEKASRMTKICVSAIIIHGKKGRDILQENQTVGSSSQDISLESTQFSGSMTALMSDPMMLMNLMNGMNNPKAKQMGMVFNQIMPITKSIDTVYSEKQNEKIEQPTIPEPKEPVNMQSQEQPNITESATPSVPLQQPKGESVIDQFKTKEELRHYINFCVDQRMKLWEEKVTNNIINGIAGKLSSNPMQLLSMFSGGGSQQTNPLSSLLRGSIFGNTPSNQAPPQPSIPIQPQPVNQPQESTSTDELLSQALSTTVTLDNTIDSTNDSITESSDSIELD